MAKKSLTLENVRDRVKAAKGAAKQGDADLLAQLTVELYEDVLKAAAGLGSAPGRQFEDAAGSVAEMAAEALKAKRIKVTAAPARS